MTLGQRIQELRKQAGMSQEALGEALGVSRQAVSKWEGDNGIPELDTLIAMSKLFSVTLGQLLGVETPEEPVDEETPETAPGFTEEQVEEILRRYVEESRQYTPKRVVLWPWLLAAGVLLAILLITLFGQMSSVQNSVNTLRTNVIDIEHTVSNVRNQVGGLSDELRDILEEQSSLLSTFDYEVAGFDVERETVDLKLIATLKTYTAGSKLQFALSWQKTDQTVGELTTDPVEGPRFETVVTIPMNFHLEISIQVIQADGTILEQPVETIYSGMHPGEFAVQFRSTGSSSQASVGAYYYDLEMYSRWPELIYPVSVVTIIELNGEEVYRQEESIIGDGGTYKLAGEASLEDYSRKEFYAVCHVTDNYGRTMEFELPGGTGSVGGVREVKQ